MSIFIEGPNGAGKSTLASSLRELKNMNIVHSSKPYSMLEAHAHSLYQIVREDDIIFDRSHAISRLVYQNHTISSFERELLWLHAKQLACTNLLIYCIGNGERDINKPHYDKELIKETSNQKIIRARYEEVMKILPHQTYDFKINKISCLQL